VKTIKGVGDHYCFIVLFAYYAKNIGGGVCPFCPILEFVVVSVVLLMVPPLHYAFMDIFI
jgi:hypothetical protein